MGGQASAVEGPPFSHHPKPTLERRPMLHLPILSCFFTFFSLLQ
jgi:hypothetical protein